MQQPEIMIAAYAIHFFVGLSECSDLQFCDIKRETQENGEVILIIDCPSQKYQYLSNRDVREIVDRLWAQRDLLVSSALLLGLPKRLILKMLNILLSQ